MMSSDKKEESSSSHPEIIEENSTKVEDSKVAEGSSVASEIKGNKTDVKNSNKEDKDAEENDKNSDIKEIKKDNDVGKVKRDSDIEIIESDDEFEKGKSVKNGRIKGKTDTKSENESEKEDVEKDESEKEESEDEEGDKEMGLLDRPVEVSGCRARKKVERLDNSFTVAKEKQGIPEGKGQKLGEIPIIEFQISKRSVAELKLLHRILFTRPGSVNETKKNIRKFSGFLFEKGSGEYDQKKTSMEKLKIGDLKKVCEVLHIERGGTREDIILRILDFLLLPKDSGKAVPKKKSTGRARKKITEKKSKNSKKKSKIQTSDEVEDDEIAPSASDASDDSAGEEQSDYESKKSKSTPKGKKTVSKAKSGKKEKPKKESVKGTKRKRDIASDSSDEDDEPVAKKSKMPTDDEIKKLVKKILDKADLQEITMKKVIKQVFDTYPDCDLAHKKAFIKSTIKSVIA